MLALTPKIYAKLFIRKLGTRIVCISICAKPSKVITLLVFMSLATDNQPNIRDSNSLMIVYCYCKVFRQKYQWSCKLEQEQYLCHMSPIAVTDIAVIPTLIDCATNTE